jgi:TRAP-type C4-dicarboxylate transport system substrate-binding protein
VTAIRIVAIVALAAMWFAPTGVSAADRPVEVVVGGTAFRGTAGEQQWMDFQRRAETASKGSIRMKMLIRGELGSEEQLVSALRRGRVQYANLSALVASTIVPEISVLYAPYLFNDEAETDFVFDTYLTREFAQLFARRGLEFIVFYDLGFQQMWSRKKPLLVPADARGIRFRVSASKSAEIFGRALKADLIPLGFAEIIPSLQTGLIEAGENGVTLYARTGTAAEAPHLTMTNHGLALSLIVADKRWWDRQTPAHQKILRDSFPTAKWLREATRAEIANDLREAQKLKIQVHRLTPAQRAEWVRATAGTQRELLQEIGGDSERIYNGILTAKRAFASRPVPKPAAPKPAAAVR